MSSFDFSELTRLVVAAHEAAVRVEISVGGFRQLEIALYARVREGGISTRHPTLEDGVAYLKTWRWAHCPIDIPSQREGEPND